MNRREFTASLAAGVAAPLVPLPVAAAQATQVTTAPPMAYLFADLIARSRGVVDAGFLSRRLQISGDVAHTLVKELVANGVVRTPGIAGIAQAIKPMHLQPQLSSALSGVAGDAKSSFDQVEALVERVAETDFDAEPRDTEKGAEIS